LQILSFGNDAYQVSKHVNKCFDNISNLKIDENGDVIGMISSEGEVVEFKPIKAKKENVENWMRTLEEYMRNTVSKKIKEAYDNYYSKEDLDRKEWVLRPIG
jgi:dynein heavy chain